MLFLCRAKTSLGLLLFSIGLLVTNILPAPCRNLRDAVIDKSGVVRFFTNDSGPRGSYFSAGLAPVKIGKYFGYIDKTGGVVIKPKFKTADPFSEEVAVVETKSGEWSFIDKTGNFIIQEKYKSVGPFFSGVALVQKQEGYTFIDKSGRQITNEIFEQAGSFFDMGSLAPVKKNGKWGFINKSGQIVIPPRFDLAYRFNEGRAFAQENGRWHLVDLNGNDIAKLDDGVEPSGALGTFSEGLAAVRVNGKKHSSFYINVEGKKFKQPMTYNVTNDFHEGLGSVEDEYGTGFINRDGERVIKSSTHYSGLSEGLFPVYEDGKWGYMNAQGQMIIHPKFEQAGDFHEGCAFVKILKEDHER